MVDSAVGTGHRHTPDAFVFLLTNSTLVLKARYTQGVKDMTLEAVEEEEERRVREKLRDPSAMLTAEDKDKRLKPWGGFKRLCHSSNSLLNALVNVQVTESTCLPDSSCQRNGLNESLMNR